MGGTERHLSMVLPALARRGWKLEVKLLGDGGPFATPVEAAGIPVENLARRYSVPIPKVGGASTLVSQVYALFNYLRARPPRILHCFLPTCCVVGGAAAWMAGFSPVVMSRRSQAARPSVFPGEKLLERWALRRSSLVFAHSHVVRDELRAEGIEERNLLLNHNGVDFRLFDSAKVERANVRAAEGWSSDEIVFAVVANLKPSKGHVDLLRAFTRLPKEGRCWRLVLIGNDAHSFGSRLKDLAQSFGIADRVVFAGGRNDIASLLSAADVGILNSHHEGFSNAILEYMAARLPVIATATGGNLDAVLDGETGLLTPVASSDTLGEAIAALLHDPPLRSRLGEAGRRRAESMFSLDACIDRYEAAYRGLLERRSTGTIGWQPCNI